MLQRRKSAHAPPIVTRRFAPPQPSDRLQPVGQCEAFWALPTNAISAGDFRDFVGRRGIKKADSIFGNSSLSDYLFGSLNGNKQVMGGLISKPLKWREPEFFVPLSNPLVGCLNLDGPGGDDL
jgi:hypothetical protein